MDILSSNGYLLGYFFIIVVFILYRLEKSNQIKKLNEDLLSNEDIKLKYRAHYEKYNSQDLKLFMYTLQISYVEVLKKLKEDYFKVNTYPDISDEDFIDTYEFVEARATDKSDIHTIYEYKAVCELFYEKSNRVED